MKSFLSGGLVIVTTLMIPLAPALSQGDYGAAHPRMTDLRQLEHGCGV